MTFTLTREEQFKSKDQLIQELKDEDFSRVTLSFYKYVQIADPQAMRDVLFEKFYKLGR